jgi:hypothetical protein
MAPACAWHVRSLRVHIDSVWDANVSECLARSALKGVCVWRGERTADVVQFEVVRTRD